MSHTAFLAFLCVLSVSRGEILLKELGAQLSAYRQLEELEHRRRLLSDSIRVTVRERSDLMEALSRHMKRLKAAKKQYDATTSRLRSLVEMVLVQSGSIDEGGASAAPALFERLEVLEHERALLGESIRAIRSDISRTRRLHASLGKVLSRLREKLDSVKTLIVRKREEIWRMSREIEARRTLFDARHFRILSRIKKIRARLKKMNEPVTLMLPVRGAWLVARSGSGMLLSVKSGALVRSPGFGTVLYAGRYPGRGQGVVVSHPDGRISVVLDLAEILVRAGQHVDTSTPVGMAPVATGTGHDSRVTIYYGISKGL